jgi:hypothetical protein
MADEQSMQAGNRSAADNIRELTDASKQLFEAGKQMTENLNELSGRVEHATNVASRIATSPWLLAGGAIAVGLLFILSSRKSSS